MTEANIELGDDHVTENELVVVEYEHPAKATIRTAHPDETLHPGEVFFEGRRERPKTGSVGSPSVPHPGRGGGGVDPRGSNVYWGSEDGVVHIRRWPRHKPKTHTGVADDDESLTHEELLSTQETEALLPHVHDNRTSQVTAYSQETRESSSQIHEERLQITLNTQQRENTSTDRYKEILINTSRTEEISTPAPEVWLTDRPEAEDWLTDTPEEISDTPEARSISNDGEWTTDRTQEWQAITYEENSTEVLEDGAKQLYQGNEWSTFTPEEPLTHLPEEWLSTTLHPEDDWLTIMPQDDEQLTDIHENLQSLPPFPPVPPSLSPTPSTMFPSSQTPTAPPSLPPTPSPQDAVEDSLRITTRGLDFLLEASPTGQSSLDSTEFPKDDLFTLDLTITTTREGLNADARDVTFDPNQIAKATSYEGSSYPTATRSATVTTTWVEDDQLLTLDHQNLTVNEELVHTSVNGDVSELSTELQHQGSEEGEISTPSVSELPMLQLNGLTDETHESSDSPVQTRISLTEASDGDTTTLPSLSDSTESQTKGEDSTEQPGITFEYEVHPHQTNTNSSKLGGLPVVSLNMTDGRSGSSILKGSSNKTDEAVLYEIPVVTRNPGPALNPSMVVALSVCCAVVMVLAALSVALWVCRRHRNRSKIYLSREAAKPRAFFTRPMNPAVLPEESDHEDAVYMLEFQRPRPPIMLGDDQKGIYFIKREEGEEPEECRVGLGVENGAFQDVPLGEVGDQGRARLDPPKYDLKSKQDSDADSGIRVWSSTGSLHAASSPLPTHCRVPPPPYSPSISKESVCLSVHSLPSLPRNSQLFDV